MHLSDLQAQRNIWVAHNFPDDVLENSILGMVEEVGELAHHYLKMKQNIRGDRDLHIAGMLDSVADLVIFGAGIPTHLDTDYGIVVADTWKQVSARDWVRFPHDGRTQ